MKFAIVNDTTLRCMITEQEMDELGFELEDIISDTERAQDFLHLILEDAEEETGFRMGERATVSMEATMLPGKGLSLLIYDGSPTATTVKEKIRRFHDAILDYAKLNEEFDLEQTVSKKEQDGFLKLIGDKVMIGFPSLNLLIEYCRNVLEDGICSTAYKLDDEYYLVIKAEFTSEQYRHIGGLALEFGQNLESGRNVIAYLEEHGEVLIEKDAIARLQSL
ncbi:adaptor protein MecA [Eubacterium oxidoreducens]|uniref:Negative regulator of genetic competence, sporulation and motility n=1 Tax=Eubacterium oxidoreducens TaxID=1732 RepID=A0A1G6AVQ3_EUBOX|nr:adaptor protein MecA [Eubacterium oxidoreducens]SDB12353.1 Negative regulator of genetic competence, sporulation and motility [Eubacterium oxidoreducens]